MKKLFTVLAVLLVASVAFAAFSGSVKAQYNFNFDQKKINYSAPDYSAVDVSFVWDSQTYTVGELDGTHIDFALSAGFDGFYNVSDDHADGYKPARNYDGVVYSPETATIIFRTFDGVENFDALLKLNIDTFKIVGKDWEVSFIDSVALNFAKSAIDTERFHKNTLEDNKVNYSLNNNLKGNHNLAVTAFGGYQFGFGIGTYTEDENEVELSDAWDKALNFAFTAVTPEYDFNGVKATFGAGYQVYNLTWKVAASAKAAYAADKWSLSGAYDMLAVKDFVKNEIAVAFAIDPVAVDVYFNNEGATAKDKYFDYFENKTGLNKKLASNYLSAKVVVDVAKVAENVPVKVTVTGKNLINADQQIIDLEAETTVVPNFKFGAYFKDMCDQTAQSDNTKNHRKVGATVEFTGVEKLTLNAEVAYKFAKLDDNKMFQMMVGAAYAHDLFTASASVAAEKFYDKDVQFAGKAAVVSTTLVKGAELSAKAYFNLNKLQILDENSNNTNKLALACKVSF